MYFIHSLVATQNALRYAEKYLKRGEYSGTAILTAKFLQPHVTAAVSGSAHLNSNCERYRALRDRARPGRSAGGELTLVREGAVPREDEAGAAHPRRLVAHVALALAALARAGDLQEQ